NARQEADANLRAAEAALQSARLNLGYTQVRAPVSGRVGKLEITVGNLVAAGPGAPVLTTLVSVNPIYASFDADEQVVLRALKDLTQGIPVEMETAGGTTHRDRKSTRLNSSHQIISYAVFCLKRKMMKRTIFHEHTVADNIPAFDCH